MKKVKLKQKKPQKQLTLVCNKEDSRVVNAGHLNED